MFTTTLGRITIATIVVFTFLVGIFMIAAWSVNDAIFHTPELYVGEIDVFQTSAKAVEIFDVETGTPIASKNATEVLPIASITKLLTASVFYETATLEATTTITWGDVNTYGDAGRLQYYDQYSYRELLFPLLLESSNDAAVAMLRVEPTLLEKMNDYALGLNLVNTKFEDTSGLSAQNVSTAYELSILVRKLYMEHPHIFDITRLSQYLGTHTGWLNNNPLVHETEYRGGKHGFTLEAHKTDVAFFEETLASGHKRLIGYVVLGSENIPADIALLRTEVQKDVTLQ